MSRKLISNSEVLAEMLQDPQFRADWERTALARAVAEAVIRYRTERGLSQTALARLLGWRQPVVARLEAAEHNPTMDTLLSLARKLGLRVQVDVGPKTGVVAKVTKSRAALSPRMPLAMRSGTGRPPGAPSGAVPRPPSQATDAASH
jgi:transcriptional regulator with XRE-family HTH domain